jgi:hypothetical protein
MGAQINAGAASTFWNSIGVAGQATFSASFEPAIDPVGDAQQWVNQNIAAINALGYTTFGQMTNSQQSQMLSSHTVPSVGNQTGIQAPSLGSLGSLLGVTLPGFSGGLRHFVMRGVEVVIGIVLIGAAIKAFSNGGK